MRNGALLLVLVLAACEAPVMERQVGSPFVIGDLTLTVTGTEHSLLEQGPPPCWDSSQSSDKRPGSVQAAGAFGYGLGQGLAEALTGSRGDKDFDAWLAIYVTFKVAPQARPQTPDLRIELSDTKGTRYGATPDPLKSYGQSPMRPGETYRERVLFKVYSDAKQFDATIGSNHLTLEPTSGTKTAPWNCGVGR